MKSADNVLSQTLTYERACTCARTGMFAAFALLLAYAETFLPLPIPVPGAKLGLANIAVLMALDMVGWKGALAVAVIKTVVTGCLFGSPIMLPYSAAGTLLAFIVMALLVRVPGLSVVLISVFGSLCHIVGQLFVAMLMLGTALVWFSLPILMVLGIVTGSLTGLLTRYLLNAQSCAADTVDMPASSSRSLIGLPVNDSSFLSRFDPGLLIFLLLLYTVGIFLTSAPAELAWYAFVAAVFAMAARLRPITLAKAFVPLLSVLVITAVAHFAYAQSGTVIATLGPLNVTSEALTAVGVLFVRLLCLMTASTAAMVSIDGRELLDGFAKALKRIAGERLWVRETMIALDLALEFVPILIDAFEALKRRRIEEDGTFAAGSLVKRMKDYGSLLAPLASTAFTHADLVARELTDKADSGKMRDVTVA